MFKRVCKLCGKEFLVDGKSRSNYCSDECRCENNRQRCLRHYYKTKEGCPRKGDIRPPEEKVFVKIIITKEVPVFDEFMPKIGSIYEAEKVKMTQYLREQLYIIPSIGKYGLILRSGECEEVNTGA